MSKIVGISGFSNSGKTTLISKLIVYFKSKNYKVAVVKHAKSGFKFGEGDTEKFIKNNADCVAGISEEGVLFYKKGSFSLEDILKEIGSFYDIVLIEGFKKESLPKLFFIDNNINDEGITLLKNVKENIVGFVGEESFYIHDYSIKGPYKTSEGEWYVKFYDKNLPYFDRDDIEKIAEFIMREI
ncbi:MAG: molybdopterin-guanine dinucleotide biosynthesis protein B [Thermovenabulum sp.]|uniref:molybdopterin-guanine dinucleotide biosynthesis protein B n=1 Tax=Thermovenabulum sp. TaxID=3100335 RepID=UPI003C7A050F